jgi:hypothetical protein
LQLSALGKWFKPLKANTKELVLAEMDTCLHNLQQVTALKLPTLLVQLQPRITDTVEETCAPPVWLRSYHIRTMLSNLHRRQTTSSTHEEDKARD